MPSEASERVQMQLAACCVEGDYDVALSGNFRRY